MRRQADQSPAQAKELSSEEEEEESEEEDSSEATSSEEESGSEEDDDEVEEEDEDEAALEKQRLVESDLQDLRRMLEDMDKIKMRLQFRLNSEREAKLAEQLLERELLEAQQREQEMLEAQQQQQQREQEILELQRQHREREMLEAQHQMREKEAIEQQKREQELLEAQQLLKSAQVISEEVPAPRYVTKSTQTKYKMAYMERMEQALVADEERKEMIQAAHVEQTASPPKAFASVAKPVRLSLYDLVKSCGLKETVERPSIPPSPRASMPKTQAQDEIATGLPQALDESENSTLFIRRDSERNAAWQEDSFAGSENLPQGKDSIITSPSDANEQDQEEALFRSLQSNPRRAPRKAFRSSIDSERAATTAAAPSEHIRSQRPSRFDWPAEIDHDDDEADKTDAQREMDAICALLF